MTDHDALLRAVCEYPDDDTPRLVMADWYQENGDPDRGELIRVQCESHARFRRSDLFIRSVQLLSASGTRWRSDLPRSRGIRWGGFVRGFIESLTVTDTAAFALHINSCFDSSPLTQLTLRKVTTVGPLLASEHRHRLRHLTVWCEHLRQRFAAAMIAAGPWPNLRDMTVRRAWALHPDDIKMLAAEFGSSCQINTNEPVTRQDDLWHE